ncbi:MAG: beta-phosphoglucomutase family hydrolase [Candidatus Melainabacteria bacterium]|nr:MAG: beta-phosphoglucomutase family hydrolase [Candidatus Melainabacteria bacterium]
MHSASTAVTLENKPPLPEQQSYEKAKATAKPVKISSAQFDAVLFDMDGVITKTANVHAQAWKEVFDQLMQKRSPSGFQPFVMEHDYPLYVDGKPRYDGVQSFLTARGIQLPWGKREDAPGFDSVCAIGNLKENTFLERVKEHGVEAYETTVALIRSLKKEGIKVAVVTSSENGTIILEAANVLHLFDAKVDGRDAIELALKGKPAPDIFLEAAKKLGVEPKRAIVVEDAVAGVEAGRNGGFGLVIGVNRNHSSELLKAHGAGVVVSDLGEVGLPGESPQPTGTALSDLGVTDEHWILKYEDYAAQEERRRETLCGLGNGYFVTRAAAPESKADGTHFPGTYVAGIYDRLTTETHSMVLEREDLVNMPNWLPLSFAIEDDAWFDCSKVEILSYEQRLNLKEGVLYRDIRFRDRKKRETSIFERRFVHMQYCHLAGLEATIVAHNWSGNLKIRTALDGQVANATSVYEGASKKHLKAVESSITGDVLYLKMQTVQSGISVAEAASSMVFRNDQPLQVNRTNIVNEDYVAQEMQCNVSQGDRITIQKCASLFTSRDLAISEAGLAARDALADAPPFATLIDDQVKAWRRYWFHFDLAIETTETVSKIGPALLIHLNTFHLLSVASGNSLGRDTALPARGWSEGYQGHVFWDDMYVFPIFTLRAPAISRELLKYRFHRLPEARKIAKSLGFPGARFPWQSASTGREETPAGGWNNEKNVWVADRSHMQVHVNAAIAFNIWQYYQASGDLAFMYIYGADVLLEIARFFAHFAHYNAARDRYEIHGVVGPDEIHINYPDKEQPGINNNAYTNLMAVWTICRALETLEMLSEEHCNEICSRLNLTDDELKLWDQVSRKMFVPVQENGIISQFEGYEKLQVFPWQKDGFIDVDRLTEVLQETGGYANQYQVSKQPDVLMLFYLFSSEELKELFDRLNYHFDPDMIPKNISYYVPQTANYSTLSRVAIAWVLSRMNRPEAWRLLTNMSEGKDAQQSTPITSYPRSWDIFQQAVSSDLESAATPEGIHLGAMAGTVDIVQRCYTGIVTKNDVLWVNPCLPEALTRLSFHLQYRQQTVNLEITKKTVSVSTADGAAQPIKVGFDGKVYVLGPSESKVFNMQQANQR